MKRLLLIVLLIFTLCFSCSCAAFTSDSTSYNLHRENDTDWVNNRFLLIEEALNNNDSESFKMMFAPSVRDSVADFEESINELFEFIEGDIISIDETTGYHTRKDADHGNVKVSIFSWTNIKTSEAEYHISIKEDVYDNVDRNNEGIVTFKIFNEEDRDSLSFYGIEDDDPEGIIIYTKAGDISVSSSETTE